MLLHACWCRPGALGSPSWKHSRASRHGKFRHGAGNGCASHGNAGSTLNPRGWQRLCLTRECGINLKPNGCASHGNAGSTSNPNYMGRQAQAETLTQECGVRLKPKRLLRRSQVCVINRVGWAGEKFLPCGHNVCVCTSDQDCIALQVTQCTTKQNSSAHNPRQFCFTQKGSSSQNIPCFSLTFDSEINRYPERTTGLFLSQTT